MSNPILTIGDDFTSTATVKLGGSAVDLSTANSVKAKITNAHSNKSYTDTVTLSSLTSGSDWANGVVVFNFTASKTSNISKYVKKEQEGLIELQVTDSNGKKSTWRTVIDIIPGNIS